MRYSKIPPVDKASLRDMLFDAHSHTLAVLGPSDVCSVGLQPPRPDCDPLLWSLGHIVWFQEKFGLRSGTSSQIAGADTLFDPAITRRRARWEADLPDGAKLLAWKSDVIDRLIDSIAGDGLASVEDSHFVRLAIQIEDMQGEALTRARQALGLPGPDLGSYGEAPAGDAVTGDVSIPGGIHMLGASSNDPFYMDNEKWGHGYEVKPFAIARGSVTNAEYRDFVEDEGYQREELWSRVGWGWCRHAAARHPHFWERRDGVWGARIFDRVEPLVADAPVVHVTWYEAEAWCRWAHRRLPWEGEWEVAAQRVPSPDHETLHGIMRRYPWGERPPTAEQANMDGRIGGPVAVSAFPGGDSGYGCRQMAGNVWEWTASAFDAYTGFMADPWDGYSVPHFDGRHGVLHGGSWATRDRAVWNSFRGFQPFDRADAFAGFRTCAL